MGEGGKTYSTPVNWLPYIRENPTYALFLFGSRLNISKGPVWAFVFRSISSCFLHLEELFCGMGIVVVATSVMESLDNSIGFIVSVLLEKPAGREWEPWAEGQEHDRWHCLKSRWESPSEGGVETSHCEEETAEANPG